MKYTDEQKKILRESFAEADITSGIAKGSPKLSAADAKKYKALKKLVRGYLTSDLGEADINRNLGNFSADYPINLLVNTDAGIIAEKATQIMSSESETEAALEQFFGLFEPLLETAMQSYCEAKGKTEDTLTDEDMEIITNRITTVVNEELLSALVVGQQMPEIFALANELPAHQDYTKQENRDSVNFYNKWNHSKTRIGRVLSLSEQNEELIGRMSDEESNEYFLLRDSFLSTLDDTEQRIFEMREVGRTQAEIAKQLGFKNHSAVTKRLQTMREKFEKFIAE
ncbi:MAG: sigma-70 family RNA polymerase sigma factor [Oscillospiraceae bacterium]|nr:sigma-70 family RNA polymerase sigma factor [Oscillospiraceae bacterium]